jgi:threonine/homoserine/homoserine lactone efflux protein
VAVSPIPIAAAIVILFTPKAKSNGPSFMLGWIIGLLVVAAGSWKKRPASGETAETPGWMASLDEFGLGKSFGIGFLLSAVNPKNLMLVLAAAVTISASDLSMGSQVIVLLVFVAIAASTVVIPVIWYLLAGERADATLSKAKGWLIQNNSTVMAVLLLVFGVKLIGDAASILL